MNEKPCRFYLFHCGNSGFAAVLFPVKIRFFEIEKIKILTLCIDKGWSLMLLKYIHNIHGVLRIFLPHHILTASARPDDRKSLCVIACIDCVKEFSYSPFVKNNIVTFWTKRNLSDSWRFVFRFISVKDFCKKSDTYKYNKPFFVRRNSNKRFLFLL